MFIFVLNKYYYYYYYYYIIVPLFLYTWQPYNLNGFLIETDKYFKLSNSNITIVYLYAICSCCFLITESFCMSCDSLVR
jgi:hypothetical protein